MHNFFDALLLYVRKKSVNSTIKTRAKMNKYLQFKDKKLLENQGVRLLCHYGLVAHRGQLSNQIIERFSKIYELKGVLSVSMLEPALLFGGCKVAI
jgi:hypothetical protein